MKIALVTEGNYGTVSPPINLGYLAAVVRENFPTIEIRVFDGAIDCNLLPDILNFNPDVLGVSTTTPQALRAYKLLDTIKRNLPNTHTIIGGVHASALPEEASRHADIVVVGEGEIAIVEILKRLLKRKPVPRIVQGKFVPDINLLPSPAYDLLQLEKYIRLEIPFLPMLELPIMRMITQRGCPYRCPFCYNSQRDTPVRYLNAARTIKEIQRLVNMYGIRSVWFNDDEFLVNKKRLREFVELLKQSGLSKRIKWACTSRVTSITQEIARLIKDAGCVCLFLGIESVAAKPLEYLKCGTVKRADIEKALAICHEVGLSTYGSFIIGSPNESIAEMQETLDWIIDHRKKGLTLAGIGLLAPYPKTDAWNYAIKTNVFTAENVDYDRFHPKDFSKTYIVDRAVSVNELASFIDKANRLIWLDNKIASGNKSSILTSKSAISMLVRNPKKLLQVLSQ